MWWEDHHTRTCYFVCSGLSQFLLLAQEAQEILEKCCWNTVPGSHDGQGVEQGSWRTAAPVRVRTPLLWTASTSESESLVQILALLCTSSVTLDRWYAFSDPGSSHLLKEIITPYSEGCYRRTVWDQKTWLWAILRIPIISPDINRGIDDAFLPAFPYVNVS